MKSKFRFLLIVGLLSINFSCASNAEMTVLKYGQQTEILLYLRREKTIKKRIIIFKVLLKKSILLVAIVSVVMKKKEIWKCF